MDISENPQLVDENFHNQASWKKHVSRAFDGDSQAPAKTATERIMAHFQPKSPQSHQ